MRSAGHRLAYLDDALRVEVRRGFVEDQQSGSHRERPGEREPLLLSTGERLGRTIERNVEPDSVERGADALPDLVAGDAEVLASERDIVPDPSQDHLRVGVLHHQSRAPARGRGGLPVDEQRPLGFALFCATEDAGEPVEQGRFS